MRPWHIRTQQEILDRIHEAIIRGDQGDEFNEYMRCAKFIPLVLRGVYEDTDEGDWEVPDGPGEVTCDDARAIDHTARMMLPHFERAMRRSRKGERLTVMMRQYRAWKWLLGHEDADEFFGAPTEVYKYLLDQVATGQWAKMFGQVKKGTNAVTTKETTTAIHSQFAGQQVG